VDGIDLDVTGLAEAELRASTRREATFQSRTVARSRWWPAAVASSTTADAASVA